MSLTTHQWHLATQGQPVDESALESLAQACAASDFQLLIVFGDVAHFRAADGTDDPSGSAVGRLQAAVRRRAPQVQFIGCSTAGEIVGRRVHTGSLVVTGLRLQGTRMVLHSLPVALMEESAEVGQALSQALRSAPHDPPLRHMLVLAPGVEINGSALVEGLREGFTGAVLPGISGGLAGDGGAFRRTYTLGPAGVTPNHVVVIGFYGQRLQAGSSARGGWEPFGPVRRVTRARGNRLDEMDHEPALTIYKRYLGEYAKDLPASGLLFPLEITGGPDNGLIRTILGIDEAGGGLILAGDVEVDSHVRLMHASPHQLIEAAEEASRHLSASRESSEPHPALAVLVSCVGRRIVMGDMTEEEVEAVSGALPAGTCITGFYSNGEIAAWNFSADCRLHNQTMTITWLAESGT